MDDGKGGSRKCQVNCIFLCTITQEIWRIAESFYGDMGFVQSSSDECGNSVWRMDVEGYEERRNQIALENEK